MPTFPVLMHTALDSTDCRGLAEFYRQFLGLRYRPGDERPEDGTADPASLRLLRVVRSPVAEWLASGLPRQAVSLRA